LTLVRFGQNVSNYALLIFLPQIVKAFGVTPTMTGVISAVSFVFAAGAMIYWGAAGPRRLYLFAVTAE